MRSRRPEGYDESRDSPTAREEDARQVAGRLRSVMFQGPAGTLEGLWKEAADPAHRRGAAVFGHPHPLHGGTMHNKVVYRAAQALTRAGYDTLRFNFRGVGLSEGRYDAGRGEVEDFRAALDEAERTVGLPIVAGGFSFGSAVGLKAFRAGPPDGGLRGARSSAGDRVRTPGPAAARVGSVALRRRREQDTFGPPEDLERFLGGTHRMVVSPGRRITSSRARSSSSGKPSPISWPRFRRLRSVRPRRLPRDAMRPAMRPMREPRGLFPRRAAATCSRWRADRSKRTFAASRLRVSPPTGPRPSGRAGASS